MVPFGPEEWTSCKSRLPGRKTDKLLAAGQYGQGRNVKKGPVSGPWDMPNVVAKIEIHRQQAHLCSQNAAPLLGQHAGRRMRSLAPNARPDNPVVMDATQFRLQANPAGKAVRAADNANLQPVMATRCCGDWV